MSDELPGTAFERQAAAQDGDTRWCTRCGGDRVDRRSRLGLCPACRVEREAERLRVKNRTQSRKPRNRARLAEYRKTEAFEAWRRAYQSTDEYKAADNERAKKYAKRLRAGKGTTAQLEALLKRQREAGRRYREKPEVQARAQTKRQTEEWKVANRRRQREHRERKARARNRLAPEVVADVFGIEIDMKDEDE